MRRSRKVATADPEAPKPGDPNFVGPLTRGQKAKAMFKGPGLRGFKTKMNADDYAAQAQQTQRDDMANYQSYKQRVGSKISGQED